MNESWLNELLKDGGAGMKTVKRSELGKHCMVVGNESKFDRVIDNGVIHEWIGFGGIGIVKATRKTIRSTRL